MIGPGTLQRKIGMRDLGGAEHRLARVPELVLGSMPCRKA